MNVVNKLIELQGIDSQIFRIKTQVSDIPRRQEEGDLRCAAAAANVKAQEEQLKVSQLRHKELDLDLQQREQQIAKQKSQMFQVKTNKEFAALQLEIEKARADNSLLEEEIIRVLETIDQVKAAVESERKHLADIQAGWKQQRQSLTDQQRELEQRLASLGVQRREVIAQGIPSELIGQYERILAHTGELAIVPVVDDACQGCSMKIRPQVVSELQLGKLHTCDNCARLLYVRSASDA